MLLADLLDPALLEHAVGAVFRQRRHDHVVPDREHAHDPGELAVLSQQRQACGDRVLGLFDPHRLAVHDDLAALGCGHSEEGFEDFGATRPHQAGKAEDLAAAQLEADVLDEGATVEATHGEHDITDLGMFLGEHLGQLAPHHEGDELVPIEVGGRKCVHELAVAEHRDVVGDLEDLVHLVRDVDDRLAALAQLVDHPVEVGHLDLGDRRGRLVHDDDPRVKADRLGDLDHLGLSDREAAHLGGRVDPDLPPVEELAALIHHDLAADQPEPGGRFPAQEDVLRDGHLGHRREFLVDHRDAVSEAGGGVLDRGRLTIENDRTPGIHLIHADEDLHQG